MMNSEFTLQIPIAGFRAIILTWIGAACFGMQAQAVGTLSSATPSTVELLDGIRKEMPVDFSKKLPFFLRGNQDGQNGSGD